MDVPRFRDPIGLLDRGPELAVLAERSPALRKAIERGRALDAYRALYWATKLGRFKGELAATAKTLLGQRRVFFKPLAGAPRMFTYNGIGTSLYGRSDFDAHDGTYVATLFAVVVFVPVFPIASYLVRDASNAGRRAWTFMAKVPLDAASHLWQRTIAAGILAMIAFGAASGFEGYGHATVHIVNGLDTPVSAALGVAPRVSVLAGGEVPVRTKVGKQTITIFDGDRVLESVPVEVPRGHDAVVWNILGAAPVFVEQVVYSSTTTDSHETEPVVLCGESLIVRGGIDYAFVPAPKSISSQQKSGSIVKTRLGIANGGLHTCTDYLVSHGKADRAAHLALTIARASQTPAAKLEPEFGNFVVLAPRDEGEAFTKDLLTRDDSVEAHRLYQDWLLGTDQRKRAIAEYEARAAARPNDADAEYLVLRLRPTTDDFTAIDAAVAKYPRHAYLRHMQIFQHRVARDFPGVVAAADALHGIDRRLWSSDLDEHVEGLVAVGRGPAALELLNAAITEGHPGDTDPGHARFLAFRVAHRMGTAEPELPQGDADREVVLSFQRVAAGIDVSESDIDKMHDDDAKACLRIGRATRSRPDAALSLARTATARALQNLPPSIRMLLLAEAARRQETRDQLERLAPAGLMNKNLDAVVAYVRDGTPAEELHILPLEWQAALDFVRSRATGLTPKERGERLARAREADVLHGPVTVAVDGWHS